MRISRYAILLSVVLGLCACNDTGKSVKSVVQNVASAAASRPVAAAPVRVALVMKTLTNPFFVEMEKGARRAEKDAEIELLVKTATQETSIEQQIQIVEELIQEKVAAIVIAPGDSVRLVPTLKKAQDAGIKVVNVDNRLDASVMQKSGLVDVPFISVDNEQAAYLSAKYVADQVKKPTKAVILEGIRSADNAMQRKLGAERALMGNRLIQLVGEESANWKIDEAYDVSKKLFKANPDIGLVFCANDMMAIGVVKYLQETKNTKVLVAGFDALDDAKAAIKAGYMRVTVDQQAAEQGYQGVMVAVRLLRGEKVPATVIVDAKLLHQGTLQ